MAQLRIVLVALYGLAMALLPFAHHVNVAPDSTAPTATEMAAFALPDGSLPLICQRGQPTKDGTTFSAGCQACMLMSCPGLVAPPPSLELPLALHADALAVWPAEQVARHIMRASAQPRAPPLA